MKICPYSFYESNSVAALEILFFLLSVIIQNHTAVEIYNLKGCQVG